jgi:hypothetical protein
MYSYLNCVSDFPYIPQQAFLYAPKWNKDPKEKDDFKNGESKKQVRYLFEGWAQ